MKYKHIRNGELIYETNNASEFVKYLLTDPRAQQIKYSVLYNLLEKNDGYICETIATH